MAVQRRRALLNRAVVAAIALGAIALTAPLPTVDGPEVAAAARVHKRGASLGDLALTHAQRRRGAARRLTHGTGGPRRQQPTSGSPRKHRDDRQPARPVTGGRQLVLQPMPIELRLLLQIAALGGELGLQIAALGGELGLMGS